MTGIERLLQEPAAQAIGWALLHFVWQGTVVALLAAVALALMRRSDATRVTSSRPSPWP